MTFPPNPALRQDGSAPRGSIYHYSRRERGENENFVGGPDGFGAAEREKDQTQRPGPGLGRA